jgi:hypothetical protein
MGEWVVSLIMRSVFSSQRGDPYHQASDFGDTSLAVELYGLGSVLLGLASPDGPLVLLISVGSGRVF